MFSYHRDPILELLHKWICKVPLKPKSKRSSHWKVYYGYSTPTLHRRTVYSAIDSYLVLFIRLDDRSV